ncbi:hypothetical protein V8D89_000712 [Ganoderma adspersum]
MPWRRTGPAQAGPPSAKNLGLAASSLSFVTVLAAAEGEYLEPQLGLVYYVVWAFIVGATATMKRRLGGDCHNESLYTPDFLLFVLQTTYPLLLAVVIALSKSLLFEDAGFE